MLSWIIVHFVLSLARTQLSSKISIAEKEVIMMMPNLSGVKYSLRLQIFTNKQGESYRKESW